MAKIPCPLCKQPGDELLFSIACLTPGCPNYKPLNKEKTPKPDPRPDPTDRSKCRAIENERLCDREAFVLCESCATPVCADHVVMHDTHTHCPRCFK